MSVPKELSKLLLAVFLLLVGLAPFIGALSAATPWVALAAGILMFMGK